MTKKALRNLLIAVGLILVLSLVWGIVFLVPALDRGTSNAPTASATQVARTVSGKTIDEDRQEAALAAEKLLNEALALPANVPLEDFLQQLNDGDLTQVPASVTDKLRFVGQFEDSKDSQAGAYQTLYALAFLIKSALGTDAIAPVTDTSWKNVLVDQEAGVAYVPMAIFTGQSSGFSMELVYISGSWKLSPYSLVEAVKLSAALSNGSSAAE